MNREEFMKYFRSEEFYSQLTTDDCLELFLGSLKGSSDLTRDLLNKLCADYDTDLPTVLKKEANHV